SLTISDSTSGMLLDGPRLRDEELLEQTHGVAIGHARNEVARRSIESFVLDGSRIQELVRTVSDFLPETAQNVSGLPELRGGDGILIDRVEEKASQLKHGAEHRLGHADLAQLPRQGLRHHISDEGR